MAKAELNKEQVKMLLDLLDSSSVKVSHAKTAIELRDTLVLMLKE